MSIVIKPSKNAFAKEVKTLTNYPRSIDQARETSNCKLIRKKNTSWQKKSLHSI